jgi:hypothetical protein
MSGSINTFFAGVTSTALALGDQTATKTATSTAVLPGAAIGYATAVSVAQDTGSGTPSTSATTDGIAAGGYTTSSHVSQLSFDFPYGPTPVSVDVSLTSVSSHGGGYALSGYGLLSPSLHGLL